MSLSMRTGQKHTHTVVRETPRRRILHLINNFEIGGTERQAVELLKRLDRDRYDVQVAAILDTGPLREELLSRYPKIHEFPLNSFYNLNALKQLYRLRKLLRSAQIDILHTHDFYAGVLGTVAARWTGVRIIVSQRHLRLSERFVHEWGRRVINSIADRVLVNAQAIRTHLITSTAVPDGKIVVIHNGMFSQEGASCHAEPQPNTVRDQLCTLLGLPSSVQLVGSVGNLRPVKGYQYLIEAAARVIRLRPETHFIIVGDGEQRHQIEAHSRQLGIASHVHLLGHRTDAIHLISGFDLAVLSSLHEGLPNFVIEAMGTGVATVATAVGGVPEILLDGETGLLVPPGDSQALTDRILDLLTNDQRRNGFAFRGQESVRSRFSMARMVQAVEELYDELTAITPTRPSRC